MVFSPIPSSHFPQVPIQVPVEECHAVPREVHHPLHQNIPLSQHQPSFLPSSLVLPKVLPSNTITAPFHLHFYPRSAPRSPRPSLGRSASRLLSPSRLLLLLPMELEATGTVWATESESAWPVDMELVWPVDMATKQESSQDSVTLYFERYRKL